MDYQINNTHLILGNIPLKLHDEIQLKPGEFTVKQINLNNQPTKICYINPGNESVSTEILDIEQNYERINELVDRINLKHVEPHTREIIQKIIVSYADIFALQSDLTPCTELTQHQIILKNEKPLS